MRVRFAETDDVFPPLPRPPAAESVQSKTAPVLQSAPTQEQLIAQRETVRSATRSVQAELQRGEIPFYGTKSDATRSVVIDRDAFSSLYHDSAFEFQDANKPPWAPRLSETMLNRIRNWILVENLTELDKRTEPWYTMVLLVAGCLLIDVDQLVVPAPTTASERAVRPTRRSVGGSIFSDRSSQIGVTGAPDTMPLAGNMTVFRQDGGFDEFELDRAQNEQMQQELVQLRQQVDELQRRAPKGPGKSTGVPQKASAPASEITPALPLPVLEDPPADLDPVFPRAGAAGTPGAGGAGGPPNSGAGGPPNSGAGGAAAGPDIFEADERGNQAANAAAANAFDPQDILLNTLDDQMKVHAAGRFGDFRNDRRQSAWYEYENSGEAIKQSRDIRAAGAQAQAWIGRPVATGIYYLNNNYVAARDRAYTAITSAADQLRTVPMDAFIADDASDPVQLSVRTQFAQIIATYYNMHRYHANRSAKLSSDIVYLSTELRNSLLFFAKRISYDAQRRKFRDIGVQTSNSQRRPWLMQRTIGPRQQSNGGGGDLFSQPQPSRFASAMLLNTTTTSARRFF